jgi:hypothetical protein
MSGIGGQERLGKLSQLIIRVSKTKNPKLCDVMGVLQIIDPNETRYIL